MLTVRCATADAAQQVRQIFRDHDVRMNSVRDFSPSTDPNTYFVIDYRLDVKQEVQIRAAVSRIADAAIIA
jgi:hypothetical protein